MCVSPKIVLQSMLWIDVIFVLVSVANATEVERLTKENAVLRNEVEQLKQELSAAEVQHKGLCHIIICPIAIASWDR